MKNTQSTWDESSETGPIAEKTPEKWSNHPNSSKKRLLTSWFLVNLRGDAGQTVPLSVFTATTDQLYYVWLDISRFFMLIIDEFSLASVFALVE